MRAKYKTIRIFEYPLEGEDKYDHIIRCLKGILNVLIDNGAPLNADEIDYYCYENTNNSGEVTGVNCGVSAPFIDSKEVELQYGDETYTEYAKTFNLSFYLSFSSIESSLYVEAYENNYVISQYGEYQYLYSRYNDIEIGHCSQYLDGPYLCYYINLVRDKESLFFGIISPERFEENLRSGINMGFTPIKSLSNKSMSEFGFFYFDQRMIRHDNQTEYFEYGPSVFVMQPTDEQLTVSYNTYEKHGGGISSCSTKIDCDETNKIVLEPLMTGFKDYYYDKVYTSNVIRSQDLTEEVVITDKGVFLKGGHPLFLNNEDREWLGSMVFDVTNSYNQEEN